MSEDKRSHVEDLRGAGRLAIHATKSITSLVEAMHQRIGAGPAILGKPLEGPTKAATSAVYGGIRAVAGLVGQGVDGALGQLAPLLRDSSPGFERKTMLAAVNGVLGDYLEETENPLAITMRFRPHDAEASESKTTARGGKKLAVMVHGACMHDEQWTRRDHDHGTALARDLGYTPAYLYYNTGLHVSANGAELAHLLQELVDGWPTPLDEIAIIGHSMGGLVARSACHVAEREHLPWREKLRSMVFLGTPHHGSPLERAGNWLHTLLGISSYSAPLAHLARLRSAGVTDLRYGYVLDEHWNHTDRFEPTGDQRTPLPLPAGVACYAIAACSSDGALGELLGDGLVPVDSGLGRHPRADLALPFRELHTWIGMGLSHSDLLSDTEVYRRIFLWLEPA